MDRLKDLREDLRKAKVIKINGYNYIINPLSSGIPGIKPIILWNSVLEIFKIADLNDIDFILTPEAMGIHIAAVLSLVTGIPFIVIRKTRYKLKGEIQIVKRTGYAESKMYIYGLKAGDKVFLVDSIIATGGTFSAIIKELKANKVTIQDAMAVIERVELRGVERVERETGYKVKTLIKVRLKDGRIKVL